MNSSAEQIIKAESGGEDAFARAAKTEPPALKSRFVSTGSVEVGEGVRFELGSLEIVADRFSGDDDLKVVEIKGQVIENRAAGLVDEGEITITCKAVRLEQFANAVGKEAVIPGAAITLMRGEDEGRAAGWRWMIEEPAR
jgi:hypothetical protein